MPVEGIPYLHRIVVTGRSEALAIRTKDDEQGKEKGTERNDRLVAIENQNHSWADFRHIDDLGKDFLKELEEFFVNYHRAPDSFEANPYSFFRDSLF